MGMTVMVTRVMVMITETMMIKITAVCSRSIYSKGTAKCPKI